MPYKRDCRMKQDRAMLWVGILAAVSGLLAISVGKFIMGGIILLLSFGIFWNRGGGKFNDRSVYEKVIKSDLTIEEMYDRIGDMDTPLGKAWIAEHKGFPGASIVFGPNKYKDTIVISRKKNIIDVKHITLVDNIIRKESDEYRFRDFVSVSETEVTPERYAEFAGLKMGCIIMISRLQEIIEKLSADRSCEVPERIEEYSFYYHNSSEGHFRDQDGADILRVENSYYPFTSKIFDEEGEEMASVVPRSFNAKGDADDSAGFDLYADGEHFGEIIRDKKTNGFIVRTDAGTFSATLFPANLRANVSFNYKLERDGALMAVIGGSPNILFDTVGRCQNDLILSYDDDYLVLYAAIEIFIMTLNKKFLK